MKNYSNSYSINLEGSSAVVDPSGLHDYDLVVGYLTRLHPAVVVGQLARLHPEDFDTVARALPAHALQVLLPASDYRLCLLADPKFDPRDELAEILESSEALDRIECHPIADAFSVRKEVTLITELINKMDIDAAKALWAALVFAQTGIDDYHRIVADWWTSEFILSATKQSVPPLQDFSSS